MNGLGRYEEALGAAVKATEGTPELFVAMWALGELIEAASRTGHAEQAESALRASARRSKGPMPSGRSASTPNRARC